MAKTLAECIKRDGLTVPTVVALRSAKLAFESTIDHGNCVADYEVALDMWAAIRDALGELDVPNAGEV